MSRLRIFDCSTGLLENVSCWKKVYIYRVCQAKTNSLNSHAYEFQSIHPVGFTGEPSYCNPITRPNSLSESNGEQLGTTWSSLVRLIC